MNYYIMTKGRVNKQITLDHLPDKIKENTFLICDKTEALKHEHQTIHAPSSVIDYSTKMQWIIDMIRERDNGIGVIMDDDLWFDIRIQDKEKLRKPKNKDELLPLFEQLEQLLITTPLVGVHPRQFGHAKPLPYVSNGKIVCLQAINTNLFPSNFPAVDEFPILSDVRLNCGLLSRGYENKLITNFVVDWAPCMAEGGCSSYRDYEMQKKGCEMLGNMFEPFLKVVKKKSKNDGFNGERYDFNVQWKRMYAEGLSKRSI